MNLKLKTPEVLQELLKDSVVTTRFVDSFRLKEITIKKTRIVPGGIKQITTEVVKYVEDRQESMAIIGHTFALNTVENLLDNGYTHSLKKGKHTLSKAGFDDITITQTQTGEIITQGLDEMFLLDIRKKNPTTGEWYYERVGSPDHIIGLHLIPANVSLSGLTPSALKAKILAYPVITAEMIDGMYQVETTTTNVDMTRRVSNVFNQVEGGNGIVNAEFFLNGLTSAEKPFETYERSNIGFWNTEYRWEWKLFNETEIPAHVFDGINTMEDTMAAMSGKGSGGLFLTLVFDKNNSKGKTINYVESDETYYDVESHTFYYDRTKNARIESWVRILPLNGGKEGTIECGYDITNDKTYRY
jgi:hypothetical protein